MACDTKKENHTERDDFLTADQKNARTGILELIKELKERCREKCKEILSEESSCHKKRTCLPLLEVEEPNIISILGTRGMGKTTVLYEILKELRQDFCDRKSLNVLLQVDVDLLVDSDQALGWIVAAFKPLLDCLEKDSKCEEKYCLLHPDSKEPSPREHYRKLWQRMQAYTSLSSDVLKRKEEIADVSSGVQSLFEESHELKTSFGRFLNSLLKALKKKYCFDDSPMIFISIEDADLNSKMGPKILEAIWILGYHPCLVYLVCGDLDNFQFDIKAAELARAEIGCIEQFPKIVSDLAYPEAEDFFEGFVFEKLNKLLPVGTRFLLRWAPHKERLAFRGKPKRANSEPSLLDLMNEILLIDPEDKDSTLRPHTLGDFFDLSWVGIPWKRNEPPPDPSSYCSFILARPRHWVALHNMMKSFVETNKKLLDQRALDDYRANLYKFLDTFYHATLRTVEHIRHERFLRKALWWFRDRYHLVFDFHTGECSIILVKGKPIQVGPVLCCPLDRYQIYKEPNSTAPLPTSLVRLLSLFHDLLCLPKFLLSSAMYRRIVHPVAPILSLKLTEDQNRKDVSQLLDEFLLHVLLDQELGDKGRFWPLPSWQTMFDYFLFEEGWNHLFEKLSTPEGEEGSPNYFLYNFLNLVVSIYIKRNVPALEPLSQTWDLSGRLKELLKDKEIGDDKERERKRHSVRVWLAEILVCLEDTGDVELSKSFSKIMEAVELSEDEKREASYYLKQHRESFAKEKRVQEGAKEGQHQPKQGEKGSPTDEL